MSESNSLLVYKCMVLCIWACILSVVLGDLRIAFVSMEGEQLRPLAGLLRAYLIVGNIVRVHVVQVLLLLGVVT